MTKERKLYCTSRKCKEHQDVSVIQDCASAYIHDTKKTFGFISIHSSTAGCKCHIRDYFRCIHNTRKDTWVNPRYKVRQPSVTTVQRRHPDAWSIESTYRCPQQQKTSCYILSKKKIARHMHERKKRQKVMNLRAYGHKKYAH